MTGQPDPQPAAVIKRAWCLKGSADDRRQRRPRLWRLHLRRQLVAQRGEGQSLEGTAAIRNGTAEHRIRTVGRDQALLDRREARESLLHLRTECRPLPSLAADHIEHLHHHGLDDIRVVVIRVKFRAIAIPSVTDIPGLEPPERLEQALFVTPLTHPVKERLDDGGEEQPVAHARLDRPRGFQCGDDIRAHPRFEFLPQLARSPEDRLRQKGRVDQRLAALREIGKIRRLRVGRGVQSHPSQRGNSGPFTPFGRAVIRQLDPRSQTNQQPAHGLEQRVRSTTFRLQRFERHQGLELPLRQGVEHRGCDLCQQSGPDRPILAAAVRHRMLGRTGQNRGSNRACHAGGSD